MTRFYPVLDREHWTVYLNGRQSIGWPQVLPAISALGAKEEKCNFFLFIVAIVAFEKILKVFWGSPTLGF